MNTRLLMATIAASAALLTGADEKPTMKTGNAFDQHFLTKTPQHHQHAIEMARLCGQKAAKSDVKAFCTKLLASQQKEKEQMESWRQSWFAGKGEVPPAEMQKMEAKHKKHMTELNASSGEKFDHTFLMSMTEHHRDGMPDMKACQARAAHAELKQLCSKMTKDQQDDIQHMQRMMKAGHSTGSAHQH